MFVYASGCTFVYGSVYVYVCVRVWREGVCVCACLVSVRHYEEYSCSQYFKIAAVGNSESERSIASHIPTNIMITLRTRSMGCNPPLSRPLFPVCAIQDNKT